MANDKVDLEADAKDYHDDVSKREHIAAELGRYGANAESNITSMIDQFDRLGKDIRDYDFVEQVTLDDGSYSSLTRVKFYWIRRR